MGAVNNLRGAKSFADLRSYTPSPVASSASFPVDLTHNVRRLGEFGLQGSSGTSTLTPMSSGHFMNSRPDESHLVAGLSNMSLGAFDRATPTRLNNRLGMDRDSHNASAVGGAIGSQRPSNNNNSNNNHDDQPRTAASTVLERAERQPRGPGSEQWNTGFSRSRQNGHGGRGSGELDLNGFDKGQADRRS